MIAHTAQLTLTTREFEKARGAVEDIKKRHKGYIGHLNVYAPAGAGRSLDATLRVPADQLQPTLAEMKRLGRVETESQSGEEVTAAVHRSECTAHECAQHRTAADRSAPPTHRQTGGCLVGGTRAWPRPRRD